ncbi:hypothetical protein [Collimonas antrihumi]|uniref:hypothetical protein n=1 Tax=Collimonas antrihumi TaxID=1940615 RepID=UPI001B8B144D|nr:hypothetical protein [Collimonas antrihumi]
MTKEQLSYGARLPWLLLFLGLTALVSSLVSRYISESVNVAIRRLHLAKYGRKEIPSVPVIASVSSSNEASRIH